MTEDSELGRKGLEPFQLLGIEWPEDLTLGEAKAAMKKQPFFQALLQDARHPEKVEVLFGWRHPDGKEEWAPDHVTIGYWRSQEEREPFISISDGSGGVGVRAPEPELVG